jgi:flagellar biosynthesis anti-sigma factor FlgM
VKINRSGSIKAANTRDAVAGRLVPTQGFVASSADRVEVSEVSAVLKRVEEALKQVSVVDTVRVEAMMKSIHEGRFMVDSAVVADRIVAAVREHLLLHNPQ